MTNIDTLHLITSLHFQDAVNRIERYTDLIPMPKIINRKKVAYTPKSSHMQNVTEFQINEHAMIRVWQHTTPTKNSIPKIHIEFIGLYQYDKETAQPVDSYKIIKPTISSMLQEAPLRIEEIEIALDTHIPFDEVAKSFTEYSSPYPTTLYSHSKNSRAVEKFCLYSKTEKNGLPVDITRLELTKYYGDRRVPVIVYNLEDIEKLVNKLEERLEFELKKHGLLNIPYTTTYVYTSYSPISTIPNHLIHTPVINLFSPKVEIIS